MLDLECRQAVADLAESILATRPLIDLLGPRIPVAAECADSLAVANVVADELAVPGFTTADAEDARSQLQRVVGARLEFDAALADIRPEAQPDVRAQAGRCLTEDVEQECECEVVVAPDGADLHTFAVGDPDAPPVVLSSACGMPARLVEPWLRHLAHDHHVVTWCSRGMFGPLDDGFDGPTDVGAQVSDGIALLKALDLQDAHVVGLCGGAVVAAVMAARMPDRVTSLSLWHGDFHPGPDTAKTDHQRNLLGLMQMAAESPDSAGNIHTVLCQSLLGSVPADIAPQVLYPYARPDLFLTYCRLNSAIMEYDLRRDLAEIRQPTLAVTSSADDTAHPQGSTDVADLIDDARLVVNDSGDHISLFRGAATPAGTNGRVRIRPRARPNALTGFNAGQSPAMVPPRSDEIRRAHILTSKTARATASGSMASGPLPNNEDTW